MNTNPPILGIKWHLRNGAYLITLQHKLLTQPLEIFQTDTHAYCVILLYANQIVRPLRSNLLPYTVTHWEM